jgi:SAM-dependent methyltransferase
MKCCNCNYHTKKFLFYSKDYITGNKFKIFKCNNCYTVFPSPQPNNLDKFYPENYRKYKYFIKFLLDIKYFIFAYLINKAFKKKIKKILEIGCGDGTMLKFFKKMNWVVYGIERNSILTNKLLNINNKKISSYKKKSFDLILMYNSLEHIKKPFNFLKNTLNKLKKDGLIIITVPNYLSYQCKFGRADWIHLDTPRHLNIFSKKTFYNYFKKNKIIHIQEISSCSFELELYGWFITIENKFFIEQNKSHKIIMNFNKSKISLIFVIVRFALLLPLTLILSIMSISANHGSTIKIILKKND